MVLAASLLVLTLMVVPLVLLVTMRRFGMEQAETEQALLSPQAADAMGISVTKYRYLHTIAGGAFAGIGGACFSLALTPAWVDRSGDQRLVVRCEAADSERVREIIARTAHATFDGHALPPDELRFDESA